MNKTFLNTLENRHLILFRDHEHLDSFERMNTCEKENALTIGVSGAPGELSFFLVCRVSSTGPTIHTSIFSTFFPSVSLTINLSTFTEENIKEWLQQTDRLMDRTVRATGTLSTDVVLLDEQVKKKFEAEKGNIECYTNILFQLKDCLLKVRSYEENNIHGKGCLETECLKAVETLTDRITDIDLETSYSFYILNTYDLVEQFREKKKGFKVKFFCKKGAQSTNTKVYAELRDITQKYKTVANKYVVLSFPSETASGKPPSDSTKKCVQCGNAHFGSYDDHVRVCLECGTEVEEVAFLSTYKDNSRMNVSSKYSYAEISHFKDCINQYQAKQIKKIPDSVYKDLENQFRLNKLLVESPSPTVRYSKIVKNHILMFLKDTGNVNYYKDANYIYYSITKRTPPDISGIEDELCDDFKKLLQVYYKLSDQDKDRDIFLNYQFIFFQLLKKRKISFDLEDVTLLKTIECIDDHNDLCQKMFDSLGWHYEPYY